MDDFDIYSDLPDFAWLKETYEENVEIKEELPTSKKDIRELKKKLLKLEKVHKLVLSHYSSLWKTCKQERMRMDRQIAELRSQLDNFAFKRNRVQNAAPPVVPVQPPVGLFAQLQTSNNYQYCYPPPPMNIIPPVMQHGNENFCSHPPALIDPVFETAQQWHQPQDKPDEHFVDNLAVPSNVITPENSHGSDESEDDIVKKSEYRSTVYGERLRKKLLEEKRKEMRQKQESALNEKKIIQEQSKHQKLNELKNSSEVDKVHVLKEKEVISVKIETDTRVVKEEPENKEPHVIQAQIVKESSQQEQKLRNEKEIVQLKHQKLNACDNANEGSKFHVSNEKEIISVKKDTNTRTVRKENSNSRRNEIKTQTAKESSSQERKLRSEREIGLKDNKKEYELRVTRERDIDRKKREEDLRIRRRDDIDTKRKDDDFKFRRERGLERRKREDEPRMRRERDIERRREEEMEKIKREQFDKRRREEETDKRRRDQEIERRKKEEADKRRRAELDRRRREEEIERRKRDELDKKRKEEEDKKRKERALEMLKEKEIERKRREEEQHVLRLKEIEKRQNEKQLEALIEERKRIENEMNSLNEQDSEEEEKSRSIKDKEYEEDSAVGKAQVNKHKPKENSNDNPKQSHKNQSDNQRNKEGKAGQRSSENCNNASVHSNNQTSNDNCRNTISKSNEHQDNHTSYDKHKYNDRRSRRDQLDRERERRKSPHRNKSHHRNSSDLRSDENNSNHSPKRIKLQEKVGDSRDRSKNPETDNKSKTKVESPKRRRQTKSDERSPIKIKRRKISQDNDLDHNIKLDENTTQKADVPAGKKIEEAAEISTVKVPNNCTKNITDSAISNINLSTKVVDNGLSPVENTTNLKKSVTENHVKALNTVQGKPVNTTTDKKSVNHIDKKKTLIDNLFETQDSPAKALANLENIAQLDKSLDETILSDLEDGELEDSDEDLPKSTSQSQTAVKPIETMKLLEKNENNNNEVTSLQKNSTERISKSNDYVKDSILHRILAQTQNNNQSNKFELHEKISNNEEPVNLKDYKNSETCDKIVNKTAGTLSEKIDGQGISVNKTKHIEVKVNKDNKTVGRSSLNKNAEVKEPKLVKLAEPDDKLKTTTEKEKQTNDRLNGSVKGEDTDLQTSSKCILNLTVTTDLLNKSNQNCLKNNNSENKIDIKERLSKLTEIHIETKSKKDTNSKENIDVSNDLGEKNIGQSPVTKALNDESSKPAAKSETLSQNNATNTTVNTSQRRNIIIVRRRRRPVQLSDSPPVVVINNATVKT